MSPGIYRSKRFPSILSSELCKVYWMEKKKLFISRWSLWKKKGVFQKLECQATSIRPCDQLKPQRCVWEAAETEKNEIKSRTRVRERKIKIKDKALAMQRFRDGCCANSDKQIRNEFSIRSELHNGKFYFRATPYERCNKRKTQRKSARWVRGSWGKRSF